MGKGHDDALAGTDEGGELVLGLGEPSRRDRGPLRLEGERLALRKRVQLGRARERGRMRDPVLLPDTAHVVGPKDEVGRVVEDGHEVVGGPRRLVLVGERELDEIGTSLRRRVEGRLGDGVERPLGEGRERADGLDLVAEELDAERLASGGREDVDEPAAHRELAAAVDPLHPLVAGEGERRGEPVDTRLEPGAQLDRLRPRRRGREPLGERPRRRADEPAAGEHVQRPRTLADQVRRGLESRLPGDATARQQPDRVLAEEPGGGLGRVARVRVLGEEADERPLEPLVERGEEHRQRGLRDAGARRQRLGQLDEPVELDELADEGVEYRTVHDRRRNLPVPPPAMLAAGVYPNVPVTVAKYGMQLPRSSAW